MALAASALVQGGDYERLGKNVLCVPGLNVTDVSEIKTDFLGHSWISDSRAVLTDLRCSITEGCNRYASTQLKESLCPAESKYYLPGAEKRDKATNGDFYWRLVPGGGASSQNSGASQTPTAASTMGGMLDGLGLKLPW
jgi:hypothetical protein